MCIRDRPYCSKDYGRLHARKCLGCKQPILGEGILAMGGAWHVEHFKCSHCDKPIVKGDGYYQHRGQLYCQADYEAHCTCLLYTSDAADEEDSVDLGGCRITQKKTREGR
eukprot:TRINITY_DN19930_c0_g2_i1.p1 TRINITY_DN19930_c0_g2~~TRINITY_DN19930_c0_g2_i1.p1  ORF type:complete len:110 (+),score=12.17 TRINITY_DN19930_c0_g2_i1:81-410(+)